MKEDSQKTDAQKPPAKKAEPQIRLPDALVENLPAESRHALERLLNDASQVLKETRNYVRKNPGEAAGLIAAGSAVLWALVGTRPGRRILEAGSAIAVPMVTNWLSQQAKSSTH